MPWHRVHADCLDPLHGKIILLMIDSFKWPEAFFMHNMTEVETTK